MADTALMYRTERMLCRPPQVVLFPRNNPLSLFKGATPTRAAIFFRLSSPNSGRFDSRVVSDFTKSTQKEMPSSLLENVMSVSVGRTATSRLSLETSIPMNICFSSSLIESPCSLPCERYGILAVPGNCPGCFGESRGDPRFQTGFLSPGGIDLSRPLQKYGNLTSQTKRIHGKHARRQLP